MVTELVEVHEAIQIESLVSGLLRSARNDGDLYRHHSFLQGIYPMSGDRNDVGDKFLELPFDTIISIRFKGDE